MEYHDSVYGQTVITEDVLQALMKTPTILRLQGILQHGITGLIGITEPITRFDHSVGALLCVRRLGASLPEQIAALLHDVSHTAFSHVIDYVVDNHDDQSYHDEHKAAFLGQSEIPGLLADFGYAWQIFLHEEDYPLLEQPAPHLCADRIDYFLRDCQGLGLATAADIATALDHLIVADGRIACNDLNAARWLGYTFMKADDASWANFREVGLYEITARAIRQALAGGTITEADFWLTDQPFWEKLHSSQDAECRRLLSLIQPQTRFVWDEEQPTFRVSTKLRAIDPDVLVDGVLRPLSTLDPDFAAHRQAYLDGKQGKWPMRVIP